MKTISDLFWGFLGLLLLVASFQACGDLAAESQPELARYVQPERAEVLATDDGVWAVLRRGNPCPYCGDIHVHGDSEGHRVAHCHNRPITLFLGAADDREFTLSNADGYWLLEPNGKES